VDTAVAAFSDDALFHNTLILGTASEAGQKLAAVVVRGPDPKEPLDKARAVYFTSKNEWAQFVAMWTKARSTKPPARTNINGDSIDCGQFFDVSDRSMVSVQVNDDATITVTVVDAERQPEIFALRPSHFQELDKAVEKVSAYFN
jgi:hypothetical protein